MMTGSTRRWTGWVAVALMIGAARADGPDNGAMTASPAARPSPASRAEAQAILRDFRELAASLESEQGPGDSGAGGLDVLERVGRPSRTVSKTTLDASAIDAMLEASHKAASVVPAKVTGDEEFLRRVSLDVAGTLPSPDQVVAFLRNKNKNKRAVLVDALLAGPDYARNWARYWEDVIRYHATAQNLNLVRFPSLEDWLEEQFAANRPWDEIASTLITASGNTGEDGSTVLMAAHQGQAVEIAGEVSRIFLGIQIQCAQCHDHPTDPWKREQFHEFAAFFGNIQARNINAKLERGPSMDVLERKGAVVYKMPDLKDPSQQTVVEPKFFLDDSDSPLPPIRQAGDRRRLAASYVTGQDNPWFARAFVNRVWASLVGEGFTTPVDDMGPTRDAEQAEVLDALADAWAEGGYDIRWLFRTILNTKTYQREFRSVTTSAGKTPFAANCPSRLRADQILDALAQALNLNFDQAGGMNRRAKLAAKAGADPKIVALAARLRGGPRAVFDQVFGVDPSIPTEDILGTIPQALFLMNSPQVDGAIRGARGAVLTEILKANRDDRAVLEAVYLRVLARSPTADEVLACGRYLQGVGNRREAFEDILWALVNSTEFLSRK